MFAAVLLILLCFKQQAFSFEPECQCSRFHYEEKTLEKMIKTEIFVDKMKSELEERQNKIDERVEVIQNDCDKAKVELELLRKNISDYAVSLKSVVSNKESVTFLARDLSSASPSEGATLIFPTVEVNVGNGYDSSAGVFTAPVGGVYMFSLQICLYANRYFYWEIMADNKRILAGCFIDEYSSYTGCHSASGVAVIQAQARVYVKKGASTGGSDIHISDANFWNYFSGTLVVKQ